MLEHFFRISNIISAIDILIVAVGFYWFMLTFKGTRAERMLWGLAVIVIVYFVSKRAELLTLHWILSNFLGSIAIFIIVVFQQDIRKALVQVGKPFTSRYVTGSIEAMEEITRAVSSLAKSRTGGLIAVERGMELTDFLGAGVEIDAVVSRELLLSIFNANSPLHDGAVVIRGGRVYRAGCILPLTEKELAKSMGTRHRAAVGLAEETDAAIIVVSEETGEITLVVEDGLYIGISPERLVEDMRALFAYKGYPRKSVFSWKAGS
ncbi:MAG: TIGR00159 family protein [Deltaproteobacteria bacterium]|nr:TIGR00159 family protein [Deltaproteobacteria bacterium]